MPLGQDKAQLHGELEAGGSASKNKNVWIHLKQRKLSNFLEGGNPRLMFVG